MIPLRKSFSAHFDPSDPLILRSLDTIPSELLGTGSIRKTNHSGWIRLRHQSSIALAKVEGLCRTGG